MTQCPIHTRPAAGSITSVSAVTVVARDVKIRQKTLKLLFATPSCVRRERSFSLAVECVRTSEAVNLSMRFGFPAVAGTVWFIPYKALVTSSISSDCAHEGGACTARGSRSVPAIQTSTRGRSWAAQFSSVDRTCTSAGSSGRSSAGDGDRSTTSSSTTRSTRRGRSAISKTEATAPHLLSERMQGEDDSGVGFCSSGVPSVTLKLAMDKNGAVDDMSDGPKRFTSQESLDAVHRIRRDCDAVLVGVETVVRDDPSLTVRRVPLNAGKSQPTRVVLDRTLRLPKVEECSILRDGHASVVFYAAGCKETDDKAHRLRQECSSKDDTEDSHQRQQVREHRPVVDFLGLAPSAGERGVPLSGVLEALKQRGVNHVLVEGGPSTARGFLSERLVDRAIIVRAPVVFSRPVPSNMDSKTLERAGLELVGRTNWGSDEVEHWSRRGLSWPRGGVDSWP